MDYKEYVTILEQAINENFKEFFPPDKELRKERLLRLAREIGYALEDFTEADVQAKMNYDDHADLTYNISMVVKNKANPINKILTIAIIILFAVALRFFYELFGKPTLPKVVHEYVF